MQEGRKDWQVLKRGRKRRKKMERKEGRTVGSIERNTTIQSEEVMNVMK